MLSVYTGLARAVLAALPPPEKAKKAAAPGKSPPPAAPPPPAPPPPAPPPPAPPPPAPPRRKNEYDNIGLIAVRAMEAATPKDPLLAYALRQATRGKIAA